MYKEKELKELDELVADEKAVIKSCKFRIKLLEEDAMKLIEDVPEKFFEKKKATEKSCQTIIPIVKKEFKKRMSFKFHKGTKDSSSYTSMIGKSDFNKIEWRYVADILVKIYHTTSYDDTFLKMFCTDF